MNRLTYFFLTLLFVGLGSCKKNDTTADAQPKTVSDVLAETPTFSLFRAALIQAGLSDALKAPNLTLFAPTDAAFRARGFSSADAFKSFSNADLANLLRYHLVTGVVTTKTPELSSANNLAVETSNTGLVYLTNGTNGLFINGVKVSLADQAVANGVIHTIDKVLVPQGADALTALKNRPDMTLLVAAIERTSSVRPDLRTILNGTTTSPNLKQITLFAPNDAAFTAAGFKTTADINNASPQTLANILTYHVLQGFTFSNQLQAGQLTTLNSSSANKLTVALPTTGPTVKGNKNATPAQFKDTDLVSGNAIIHVIDQVLQP
ncbi:fasciclin domain-containing protein [Fibrella aquatilis]|uniref:Fasciclin domain-containing protein n=1 Tax=Fibrella aquatilis TaxID=2817059 RepID=A0A939K1W8_9BACT|nr:fasciclin domain-containing protein [Fibrella aquatilis]MBO0933491.1 fasciclin domain-containing protein [Fibrella aquatilis]